MNEINVIFKVVPNYEELKVSVLIPSVENDKLIIGKNIYDSEIMYMEKRDNSSNAYDRVCYDRARAVCKFASTCSTKLLKQSVKSGELEFVFLFHDLDSLKSFLKESSICINGATESIKNFNQQPIIKTGKRR